MHYYVISRFMRATLILVNGKHSRNAHNSDMLFGNVKERSLALKDITCCTISGVDVVLEQENREIDDDEMY